MCSIIFELCVVIACSVQLRVELPQRGGGGQGRLQQLPSAARGEDISDRERQGEAGEGTELLHLHFPRPLRVRNEDRYHRCLMYD